MIATARPPLFVGAADAVRRDLLNPWKFRLYLWKRLPLAACAGLSLRQLDEAGCTVGLPGGWRTQNPFRSTYFAAQCMAAEMSTGAPAMALVSGAPASVSMLLRGIDSVFTRRIQGPSLFTFEDIAGLAAVVDRATAGGESESYVGRCIGRGPDGEPASEFRISWSFKRRK
jgi:Domain of unknown function (DUF4442)